MHGQSLPDEAATLASGRRLACLWRERGGAGLVTLAGPLGAGKTTLVRGFLAGLGYTGRVRSPTYTLLESYELAERHIWHVDLYRLGSAEELEFLGWRDLDLTRGIAFVEWPERVPQLAERADLRIALDYARMGRRLIARSSGPAAGKLLEAWLNPPG